ncbi:MAG: hypothetical protein KID05_01270 [Pseudomonas sp.]|uniref:hypothetical protein n=1 Tax=Pseudomonas sp. TaxID=306 RepID=UPI002356F469|nr:hypothetical protein [Pseudomonas sp.]MBS5837795.1 hypothetical protein [Pseudomonas sp.]
MSTSADYASPAATPRRHVGAYILIVAALVALVITAWRFFTPLSGIDGSGGAMTAMFAELVMVVLGLLLLKSHAGGLRGFLLFLSWAGIIGTFIAALFLHGWWTAAVLAVGAVGVVIETFTPATRSA